MTMGSTLVCRILALAASAFLATSAPADKAKLDPANGNWILVLDKAVADKPLTIYLATADGKVKQAAGTILTFNKAVHEVDGSALTIDGGSMKGTIKVTIKPDSYVPKDKKPIACEVQVDAALTGAAVNGTYKGKCGDTEVSGEIKGKLEGPSDTPKSGSMELAMMDTLVDGPVYLRDALLTFDIADGAAKNGQIRWVKKDAFHWTGKIEGMELKLGQGTMAGTIKADIDSRSQVLGGKYVFTIDARTIGTFVYGTTKVQLDGKDRKTSYFFGSLKNAQ
jgi:hypothetical protein